MAKQKAYGFDEKSFDRVRETVRRVLGSPKTGSQQRRQTPILGGGCVARNEIWKFIIGGNPTAGSFSFDLNVLGVTAPITINFDDTDLEVEAAFETHSNIAIGDVNAVGGPFPNTDMTVEFIGNLAKHLMDPPTTINFSGLTGGTGTIVVFVPVRPGHPRDGSVAP